MRYNNGKQELVDAIPEWLVDKKDEQAAEFVEWLAQELNITDAAQLRAWSKETWTGMHGSFLQEMQMRAYWDSIREQNSK